MEDIKKIKLTAVEKHERQLKYSRDYNYKKYHNDPNYKKKKLENMNQYNKTRYDTDEVFKEHRKEYAKDYQKNEKNKRLEEQAQLKIQDNLKEIEDKLEKLITS